MKTVAFFVLLLLLVSISTFAGNELGNGGDLVAQEFVAAGRKLVEELRKKPDPRIPNVEELAKAVETVKVSTAESLTLHGNEVDAINFPDEKHIDVSRSRWRDAPPGKRASLVLHEYLGVLNVPDKQYEISASYADAFAIPEEKPKKFEAGLAATYGSSGSGGYKSSTRTPGWSVCSGYHLGDRSTLGLNFSAQDFRRTYATNYDDETETLVLLATYKHWFAASTSAWRPYTQIGAGVARSKWNWVSREDHNTETIYKSGYTDTDFAFQIGLGCRYALMKYIGLDFSANAYSNEKFWVPYQRFYLGKLGLDVLF
jgi:hypothetical protein